MEIGRPIGIEPMLAVFTVSNSGKANLRLRELDCVVESVLNSEATASLFKNFPVLNRHLAHLKSIEFDQVAREE